MPSSVHSAVFLLQSHISLLFSVHVLVAAAGINPNPCIVTTGWYSRCDTALVFKCFRFWSPTSAYNVFHKMWNNLMKQTFCRKCNSHPVNQGTPSFREIQRLRSALFRDFTQRRVVIPCRRFGKTYRSHLQGTRSPRRISSWTYWPMKMGSISCPETSVRNYHFTLCKIPEEPRFHIAAKAWNHTTQRFITVFTKGCQKSIPWAT